MPFELIQTTVAGRVGWITLHRPDALNALNAAMVDEITRALTGFEADPQIGCVVITGSERAFAAGADIKEAADRTYPQTYLDDFLATFDAIAAVRKPLVAAVAGYALGGGERGEMGLRAGGPSAGGSKTGTGAFPRPYPSRRSTSLRLRSSGLKLLASLGLPAFQLKGLCAVSGICKITAKDTTAAAMR